MVMLRKILLLSSLFITAIHAEGENLHLFDVLKDPKYLTLWNGLFKNEVDVDDWLKNYAEWLDGPSSPGKNVIVDGRQYMIHNVCEAHNCGSNYFLVAFSEDASTALGLQMRLKYVRDFDFEKDKFVRKLIRENRFYRVGTFDQAHVINLEKEISKSRKYSLSVEH